MDYLEIAKLAMQVDIPFIISEPIIVPPVIIRSEIRNKASPIQSKKLDNSLLAKNLVSQIEGQALSLGWMPEQLARLEKILLGFMPCSLGIVGTRSININMMHSDGGVRGSVVFRK